MAALVYISNSEEEGNKKKKYNWHKNWYVVCTGNWNKNTMHVMNPRLRIIRKLNLCGSKFKELILFSLNY